MTTKSETKQQFKLVDVSNSKGKFTFENSNKELNYMLIINFLQDICDDLKDKSELVIIEDFEGVELTLILDNQKPTLILQQTIEDEQPAFTGDELYTIIRTSLDHFLEINNFDKNGRCENICVYKNYLLDNKTQPLFFNSIDIDIIKKEHEKYKDLPLVPIPDDINIVNCSLVDNTIILQDRQSNRLDPIYINYVLTDLFKFIDKHSHTSAFFAEYEITCYGIITKLDKNCNWVSMKNVLNKIENSALREISKKSISEDEFDKIKNRLETNENDRLAHLIYDVSNESFKLEFLGESKFLNKYSDDVIHIFLILFLKELKDV